MNIKIHSLQYHYVICILASVQVTLAQQDVFAINAYWFSDPVQAPYTYMESTMTVPALPPREWQTLFIWPGLQPLQGGANFYPIDNGVLQPVLTWGPTCAPNPNALANDGWWISGQYVNTFGSEPTHKGCYGGNRMAVNPGDSLRMVMELSSGSTIWKQIITNRANGQSVTFDIDMMGQAQAWAEFIMEIPGGWHSNVPSWDVSNIILRTNGNGSAPGFCRYEQRLLPQSEIPGGSLSCSSPVKNGNTCTISLCSFNRGSSTSPSSRPVVSASMTTSASVTSSSSVTVSPTGTSISAATTATAVASFSPVVPVPPSSLVPTPTNRGDSNKVGSGATSQVPMFIGSLSVGLVSFLLMSCL